MTGVNMMFFIGGPQLGELEAGLLAQWAGPVVSVVSGGIGCLVATAWVVAVTPGLRALPPHGAAAACRRKTIAAKRRAVSYNPYTLGKLKVAVLYDRWEEPEDAAAPRRQGAADPHARQERSRGRSRRGARQARSRRRRSICSTDRPRACTAWPSSMAISSSTWPSRSPATTPPTTASPRISSCSASASPVPDRTACSTRRTRRSRRRSSSSTASTRRSSRARSAAGSTSRTTWRFR